MGQFNLTLLGGFQVTLDDHLLANFATNKVWALLVYLALEPAPQPRSRLAGIFWPEISEQVALTNLRQTLRRLRQGLARVEPGASDRLLVRNRQTLYLDPAGLTIDVMQFERLLALCQTHAHATLITCDECLPRLAEAANLYRGELLAGFELLDAPAFVEWLLLRREYLQEQAVQLFHTLAAIYESRGDSGQTQHWIARQLAIDPFREDAHRQLMRSLVRQGQRLAALTQFERYRYLLQTELGIEPSAETLAVYEEIRTGRFPDKAAEWQGERAIALSAAPVPLPATRPLHNLPVELTPLVGRAQELAELNARLQQPSLRLLTLVGVGGMGKTRLALSLAQIAIQNPEFPDGVFFTSLASLANPASLASTIATTLRLAAQGGDPRQALLQALRHKHLLLILDNFEHLLAGADLVADLLQMAPGVRIIVTSRERLNLHGEQLYLVPPLDFASSTTFDAARMSASLLLFVQSAQRVQPSFVVNAANITAVLQICQLAEGMPLALELAASRVGTLPLAALAAEIKQNAEFLAVDWRDVPARQRSMRALFVWSWQLLDDDERRVLRRVSVFRGGFTVEAAQDVAVADVAVLARLVHKSLLQLQKTENAGERYTLHELLRQFAAQQLEASDEQAIVEAQHSRFYLNYVASRGLRLGRREPHQASEEIQTELDNVRQAWQWAAARGQLTELAQAAYAWWQFCLFRGLESEGRQTFAQAVEGVQQLTSLDAAAQAGLSKLLAIHANYLFDHEQVDRIAAQARQVISLGASCGGVEGETFGYFVLGRAQQDLHQRPAAVSTWQHTIQLARIYQANHPDSEMLRETEWMAYNWLRGVSFLLDDYPGGRVYIMQALRICQALGKRRGELFCLTTLAWSNFFMGDFALAERNFTKVLRLAHDLRYHWMEMPAHHGLGELMRLRGDYTQAQTLLEKAAGLAAELGQQFAEARIWASLVRLYVFTGNQQAARHWQQRLVHLHETVQLPKECQIPGMVAFSLLAHCTGDQRTALDYAEQAHQLAQAGEVLHHRADALVALGHARVEMAQWAAADAAYRAALHCYEQLDSPLLTVEPQAGLAQSALAQGDHAAAQQWVDKILPILAEHPRTGLNTPFFTWLICVQVLAASQDARTRDVLQRAYTLLQQDADTFSDAAARRRFLETVVTHRLLQQAYREY